MKKSSDLKKPLRVKFVGEQGVDQGGVQKEFFQLLIHQLFDLNFGNLCSLLSSFFLFHYFSNGTSFCK
jgi:hypothetical protein